MTLQPCALSPLLSIPFCAAWSLTQISLRTSTVCNGPLSTASHWVGIQTPLLQWLGQLLGRIMGKSRCPEAGSIAVNLLRRQRSWLTACMNSTASGFEPWKKEPCTSSSELCFCFIFQRRTIAQSASCFLLHT